MTDRSIHTEALPTSIRGCVIALERCLKLLGEIDDDTFVAPSSDHGTIGAHLRHCIEYFRCFFAEATTGLVEYDARERDLALETDRDLSSVAIKEIIAELRERTENDLDRVVVIQQSLAPDSPPEPIQSTVRREWMSLSDHTIHHLAIITQLIAAGGRCESVTHVASQLGVAFSTQAHRARVGAPDSSRDPDGCAR